MPLPSAVLLDLDGTLIDSMPLFRQSVLESLARHGATLQPEYFMKWHAERLPWLDLLTEYSIDPGQEENVRSCSTQCFQELLRSNSTWMPGAKELLESLRTAGIPTGIVTTAFKNFVDAVNERLSILGLVNVCITAEDVGEKGKPNPYGLLIALEKLGEKAENTIYIGDQPFDVLAANAAKMESWLVQHPHTPSNAGEQATRVFATLFDVIGFLNLEKQK